MTAARGVLSQAQIQSMLGRLMTLLQMVDERRLSPVIDRVLPLREAPQGLRLLAEREVIGKVVVVP